MKIQSHNTKTSEYGAEEINRLLSSVRSYNNTIGSYEEHLILKDDFIYSVKLTNGTIRIYFEELQDKLTLPRERLKDIAARFNEKK